MNGRNERLGSDSGEMEVVAKRDLTTAEVARLIGVGEATVKRWAEKRAIHSERTPGGHRRFRLEDVARFVRNGAYNHSRSAARLRIVNRSDQSRRANSATAALDLFKALVAGHEQEAATSLVLAHLNGASLSSIFDDLLCAAMRRVGDLWYEGQLSVDQEHLATRTALNTIHLLKVILDLPKSKTRLAICCSIEEDFHELPIHLTQMILESEDWTVVNLGANTPFFALTEALERHAPELVCVSSTVLSKPDRAAREYREFREAATRSSARILLGGAGFKEETRRSRFPADYYADNFRQLESFLEQWNTVELVDAVS